MGEALLDTAGKAYELIDMEQQHGRRPRVGAVDTNEVRAARGSPARPRTSGRRTGHTPALGAGARPRRRREVRDRAPQQAKM